MIKSTRWAGSVKISAPVLSLGACGVNVYLASWRRRVVLLRFDDAVATTWGGDSGPRATPRATSAVNDAWIAACCLVDGLPLATFNTKDFADFAQYDGLRLIDAERRG